MKTFSLLRDASTVLDRLDSPGIDRALSRLGLTRTSSSNGTLAMVGSFMVGIAVGAGLGVLFAPQSGTESRRAIRMKAEELYARLMSKSEADAKGETDATDETKKSDKRTSKSQNGPNGPNGPNNPSTQA